MGEKLTLPHTDVCLRLCVGEEPEEGVRFGVRVGDEPEEGVRVALHGVPDDVFSVSGRDTMGDREVSDAVAPP